MPSRRFGAWRDQILVFSENEESARRAAFQYQVHKLSEDVKVLELNLAGARGEAKAGEIQAKRLRDENEALQATVRRLGDGNSPGAARLER